MTFPLPLKESVIKFLLSLPSLHDSDSQRAFVSLLGLDQQLLNSITFGKAPAQFVPLFVDALICYGELDDGRYPLSTALDVAKSYVGKNKKGTFDSLIQQIQAYRIDNEIELKHNSKMNLAKKEISQAQSLCSEGVALCVSNSIEAKPLLNESIKATRKKLRLLNKKEEWREKPKAEVSQSRVSLDNIAVDILFDDLAEAERQQQAEKKIKAENEEKRKLMAQRLKIFDGLNNSQILRIGQKAGIYIGTINDYEKLWERLATLLYIDLSSEECSNFEFLSRLVEAEKIYLHDTNIRTLLPLQSLFSLHVLRLSNTPIVDISALKNLTQLQELYLDGTEVFDLNPLRDLMELHTIDLSGTHTTNLSDLNNLLNLKVLKLSRTKVKLTDMEVLSHLKLQELHLRDTAFHYERYDSNYTYIPHEVEAFSSTLPKCKLYITCNSTVSWSYPAGDWDGGCESGVSHLKETILVINGKREGLVK